MKLWSLKGTGIHGWWWTVCDRRLFKNFVMKKRELTSSLSLSGNRNLRGGHDRSSKTRFDPACLYPRVRVLGMEVYGHWRRDGSSEINLYRWKWCFWYLCSLLETRKRHWWVKTSVLTSRSASQWLPTKPEFWMNLIVFSLELRRSGPGTKRLDRRQLVKEKKMIPGGDDSEVPTRDVRLIDRWCLKVISDRWRRSYFNPMKTHHDLVKRLAAAGVLRSECTWHACASSPPSLTLLLGKIFNQVNSTTHLDKYFSNNPRTSALPSNYVLDGRS